MISNLNAPIVSGKGSDLPGLLGLQSLEASRAVLDVGGRKLHLLGPGELQMTVPPGTRSIPLTKAPSGHLVMIIDDYEAALQAQGPKTGGLQVKTTQFLAESSQEPMITSPNTTDAVKPEKPPTPMTPTNKTKKAKTKGQKARVSSPRPVAKAKAESKGKNH